MWSEPLGQQLGTSETSKVSRSENWNCSSFDLTSICLLLLTGHRDQRSEEEDDEEGEVDEDEEQTVKKTTEEKDSDGEVEQRERKADRQVAFPPITQTPTDQVYCSSQ